MGARVSTKSTTPTATQGVFIRFVQYLCVLFRQPKELWGKSCYPIRVTLFYSAPKIPHYVVFACTRCDAQNTPPVRLKLRLLLTLSLTSSLRLALLLVSTLFSFSSFFCLAQPFSLLLSQRLAFLLFLAQPLLSFY